MRLVSNLEPIKRKPGFKMCLSNSTLHRYIMSMSHRRAKGILHLPRNPKNKHFRREWIQARALQSSTSSQLFLSQTALSQLLYLSCVISLITTEATA
jgi:hypothetical protein